MDKEKKPRKPRAKKEVAIPAIMSSLISPVERAAIKAGQAKLVAATEKASASTLQRAIRSNLARKTVKNTRATKAMDTAGDVLAASKINRAIKSKIARSTMAKMKDDAITVTVPKAKRAKKEKVAYKMSYAAAVKMWNTSRGNAMWCNPRKGTDEYKAVMALRM